MGLKSLGYMTLIVTIFKKRKYVIADIRKHTRE